MDYFEVILHAGLHKTASTSIQRSCQKNHLFLEEQGFHYPLVSVKNKTFPNHSFMVFSLFSEEPHKYHMNKVLGYDTEEKVGEINDYYEVELLKGIKDSGCKKIILSAEDISSMKYQSLIRLKRFFELNLNCPVKFRIILFVRHLCDYTQSVIQQRVKDGGWQDLLYRELKNNKIGRIKPSICALEDAFGKENLTVFKFEDAIGFPGGIYKYFLSEIGIDLNECVGDTIHDNQSLSYESYYLHSKINEREPLLKNGIFNKKRNHADLIELRALNGVKFSLPQSKYDEIYYYLFDDFKWLKGRFDIDYSPKFVKGTSDDELWSSDTLEQLKFIIPNLSSVIRNNIIDILRELAITYERKNLPKALSLMELALIFRPEGRLLAQKVNEYKTLLDVKPEA